MTEPKLEKNDYQSHSMLHRPSPILLSSFTSVRRLPTRPTDSQEPGFVEAYDDNTLCYDSFWDQQGSIVRLVCPPFNNLGQLLKNLRVTSLPDGQRVRHRLRILDRNALINVNATPRTNQLRLDSALGTITVAVGNDFSNLFHSRRVLLTKSKDNSLEWIQDWVRFHRDLHGADAVLIYDNNSQSYTPDQLHEALQRLTGIEQVVVVHWPFKFGPQGLSDGRNWESAYCEFGILEHARRRYLARARSVLHVDIDELVASVGKDGIFEKCEKSLSGVLRFYGKWVVSGKSLALSTGPRGSPTHKELDLTLPPKMQRRWLIQTIDANRCPTKWCVAPSRCPEFAQWTTHRIQSWPIACLTKPDIIYYHFRPINNSWKYDRSAEMCGPSSLIFDSALRKSLDTVNWHK